MAVIRARDSYPARFDKTPEACHDEMDVPVEDQYPIKLTSR